MNTFINILVTIILLPWGGMMIMSPMMIASHGFKDSPTSILTAIVIIAYPVLVFLALKLFGLRFYGTNVNGWLIGASMLSTGIIFLYGLPGMLLNLNKGIPNTGYYVGENSVYLNGDKIREADPGSFTEIDMWYARDANHVYYDGRAIKGADPNAFSPVGLYISDSSDIHDSTPVFWQDQHHVYYRDQKVEKANPEKFMHLKNLYAKDDQYVYYETSILEDADPAKFRFLSEGIATDEEAIFIYQKRSNTSVDLPSFEVINNDVDTYCRDKDHIYLLFYGQKDPLVKVEEIDPETFQLLERSYAKDKDHVYYYGYHRDWGQKLILLEGANPQIFSVGYDEATDSEARDGKNYYMYGKKVKK